MAMIGLIFLWVRPTKKMSWGKSVLDLLTRIKRYILQAAGRNLIIVMTLKIIYSITFPSTKVKLTGLAFKD